MAEQAVQGILTGIASTAPNAEQVLAAMVATRPAQVRTVACYSQGSTGGTATIIDVRNNGVSVYTNPASRPTLAGGATGKFTSTLPNHQAIRVGDIVSLVCAQAGGHAGVIATAAIEEP